MSDAHIAITKDGPYLVYGGVPLNVETIGTNRDGGSWEWLPGKAIEVEERYALCRCGASSTKPFCDGTHKAVGFDGTETASREPFAEQAVATDGPAMVLEDAESLCGFARFCDVAGTIWALIEQTDDADVRKIVAHEAMHCPSGRLVVRDRRTGDALEPQFKPSLGLIEDPPQNCSGPLWVRGGVRVDSADGSSYELRNRVTLCRCGASENKPFCDGRHSDIGFTDGL